MERVGAASQQAEQQSQQQVDQIIELLKEKNSYLEKFYLINENELINFGGGNFDNVESFYSARDKLLDLIRCIDLLVEEMTLSEVGVDDAAMAAASGQRGEVHSLLKNKDEIVTQILAQDLRILEYIEKEKSAIIRELTANRQVRRAVAAYANSERMKQLEE